MICVIVLESRCVSVQWKVAVICFIAVESRCYVCHRCGKLLYTVVCVSAVELAVMCVTAVGSGCDMCGCCGKLL